MLCFKITFSSTPRKKYTFNHPRCFKSLIIIVLSRSIQVSFFCSILIQHVVVYGLRDVDLNQGPRDRDEKANFQEKYVFIQMVFFF